MIYCTKEHPWDGVRKEGERICHDDVHEVPDSQRNGWPGGDIVTYECPNCGHRWEAELPQ